MMCLIIYRFSEAISDRIDDWKIFLTSAFFPMAVNREIILSQNALIYVLHRVSHATIVPLRPISNLA